MQLDEMFSLLVVRTIKRGIDLRKFSCGVSPVIVFFCRLNLNARRETEFGNFREKTKKKSNFFFLKFFYLHLCKPAVLINSLLIFSLIRQEDGGGAGRDWQRQHQSEHAPLIRRLLCTADLRRHSHRNRPLSPLQAFFHFHTPANSPTSKKLHFYTTFCCFKILILKL